MRNCSNEIGGFPSRTYDAIMLKIKQDGYFVRTKKSKKCCLCFCALYECLIKKLSSLKMLIAYGELFFSKNRFHCFCPFRILLKVNIKGEWMFPKQEKKINTWWRRKRRWKKERNKHSPTYCPVFIFLPQNEEFSERKKERSQGITFIHSKIVRWPQRENSQIMIDCGENSRN